MAQAWHKGGTGCHVLFPSPAALASTSHKLDLTGPKVPSLLAQQKLPGRKKQQSLESHHQAVPRTGRPFVKMPLGGPTNWGPGVALPDRPAASACGPVHHSVSAPAGGKEDPSNISGSSLPGVSASTSPPQRHQVLSLLLGIPGPSQSGQHPLCSLLHLFTLHPTHQLRPALQSCTTTCFHYLREEPSSGPATQETAQQDVSQSPQRHRP